MAPIDPSPGAERSLQRADFSGGRDERRNPRLGCRKIAEQISSAFGLELNNEDQIRGHDENLPDPEVSAISGEQANVLVVSGAQCDLVRHPGRSNPSRILVASNPKEYVLTDPIRSADERDLSSAPPES